jgi:hypothetical protein
LFVLLDPPEDRDPPDGGEQSLLHWAKALVFLRFCFPSAKANGNLFTITRAIRLRIAIRQMAENNPHDRLKANGKK